jgi:hypothetical protein
MSEFNKLDQFRPQVKKVSKKPLRLVAPKAGSRFRAVWGTAFAKRSQAFSPINV